MLVPSSFPLEFEVIKNKTPLFLIDAAAHPEFVIFEKNSLSIILLLKK